MSVYIPSDRNVIDGHSEKKVLLKPNLKEVH